uniref:Myosin motor domain-containing protein n=1 Tax=Gongylonema pulchrum TaxID=637853 RepID=A0A183EV03_9BILA
LHAFLCAKQSLAIRFYFRIQTAAISRIISLDFRIYMMLQAAMA